jgi:hypothetical protein
MRVKLPDRDRHGVPPQAAGGLSRSICVKNYSLTTRCQRDRDRLAHTSVMPGLDPGIHRSSQEVSHEEDRLPGQARQ